MRTIVIGLLLSLVFVGAATAEDVAVVADLQSGRTVKLVEVPEDLTYLQLVGTRYDIRLNDVIVDIRGLEELEDLDRLAISYLGHIADYSFLHRLGQLRRLLLSTMTIDSITLLQDLTWLREFSYQQVRARSTRAGVAVPDEPIDLGSHGNLKIIMLDDCRLTRFPRFINVPPGLRYLDLTANELPITSADQPWLDELRSVEYIFVWGNEVEEGLFERYPNLTTEDSQQIVPNEWRK